MMLTNSQVYSACTTISKSRYCPTKSSQLTLRSERINTTLRLSSRHRILPLSSQQLQLSDATSNAWHISRQPAPLLVQFRQRSHVCMVPVTRLHGPHGRHRHDPRDEPNTRLRIHCAPDPSSKRLRLELDAEPFGTNAGPVTRIIQHPSRAAPLRRLCYSPNTGHVVV
jgi:hypothetical protein